MRVVACIFNVHVQYYRPCCASIDLLRVNTRGLADSGSWHCAAEGGKEVPHMNDTRKTLGANLTPENHRSQEFKGAEKKGYQSC